MQLSRIKICNFRNFSELDVSLSGNVVVVGENRVGKSNLVYAVRLLLDPTLPDSARQLGMLDFWDGLGGPTAEDKIIISIEIRDFEEDLDVLTMLTDYRLDEDHETVRLSYEFRARPDLEGEPVSDGDFIFLCYGGEDEAKRFGHDLRSRISMDVLPALRDAEGDLAAWRRSPLRPLVEKAFSNVEMEDLEKVSQAVEEATAKLADFNEVRSLGEEIRTLFAAMSGPRQNIKPSLGFSPSDPTRLYRSIRLLIDDGRRGIADASLGSANLVFLSLKLLELQRMIAEDRRDHTMLVIEEPEAHLHPHLQRLVYRHLFESVQREAGEDTSVSIFLTTHSPHIASVAPLESILLLRDTVEEGTIGRSTAAIELSEDDLEDLKRYLDVTRAEILFARGVILVEGEAERFLVPEFASALGTALDRFGVSVCSVAGTNFTPYVKFLAALGIPFSVITDWDPRQNGDSLGLGRAKRLIRTIEEAANGEVSEEIDAAMEEADEDELRELAGERGIFLNEHTLEVDLFNNGFSDPIIETLREGNFGDTGQGWIDEWEADTDQLHVKRFLSMIESIGKGRFAQRLTSRMGGMDPLPYIREAIEFVVNRV